MSLTPAGRFFWGGGQIVVHVGPGMFIKAAGAKRSRGAATVNNKVLSVTPNGLRIIFGGGGYGKGMGGHLT